MSQSRLSGSAMAWAGTLAVRTIVVRIGLLAIGERVWWPTRG